MALSQRIQRTIEFCERLREMFRELGGGGGCCELFGEFETKDLGKCTMVHWSQNALFETLGLDFVLEILLGKSYLVAKEI